MGGRSWERAKEKVRRSAEKIAGELLTIYAQRKVNAGHGYGKADSHFADFEADFPYEETPDQLRAAIDVKADLERDTPMDRLVVGDVGYGKTEVAIRAAFKAVAGGRQVAVISRLGIPSMRKSARSRPTCSPWCFTVIQPSPVKVPRAVTSTSSAAHTS